MIIFIVEDKEDNSAFFDLTTQDRMSKNVKVVFSHEYVGAGTAQKCASKVKQKIKNIQTETTVK